METSYKIAISLKFEIKPKLPKRITLYTQKITK
jgi:hypothetical protein